MLISMPHFKSIIFYQNRPRIKLFLQKEKKKFERWGLRPHTPKASPHCRFLATRLSLIMFCTANFYATKVLPNATLKKNYFYQNKPKSKLFLQKIHTFECLGALPPDPRHTAPPHCRFLVPRLILDVGRSCFQMLESYNEKLLS